MTRAEELTKKGEMVESTELIAEVYRERLQRGYAYMLLPQPEGRAVRHDTRGGGSGRRGSKMDGRRGSIGMMGRRASTDHR